MVVEQAKISRQKVFALQIESRIKKLRGNTIDQEGYRINKNQAQKKLKIYRQKIADMNAILKAAQGRLADAQQTVHNLKKKRKKLRVCLKRRQVILKATEHLREIIKLREIEKPRRLY